MRASPGWEVTASLAGAQHIARPNAASTSARVRNGAGRRRVASDASDCFLNSPRPAAVAAGLLLPCPWNRPLRGLPDRTYEVGEFQARQACKIRQNDLERRHPGAEQHSRSSQDKGCAWNQNVHSEREAKGQAEHDADSDKIAEHRTSTRPVAGPSALPQLRFYIKQVSPYRPASASWHRGAP